MNPGRRFRRRQEFAEPPDLAPRTVIDSMIRESFHRFVELEGPVTLSDSIKRVPGTIKWTRAQTPAGDTEITYWFEPEPEFALEYKRIKDAYDMLKTFRTLDEEQVTENTVAMILNG